MKTKTAEVELRLRINELEKEIIDLKAKTSTESAACSDWKPSKSTNRCFNCGYDRWAHDL